MSRIEERFSLCRSEGRAAFVAFITAGDPNQAFSQALLDGLPGAGVDVIELGMPFSDPSADGPAIDKAGQRALKAGMTLKKVLQMVRDFRAKDQDTPIVLMGYFNPILRYGIESFTTDAKAAGVDGLIVVDLPPEEDEELLTPASEKSIHIIRRPRIVVQGVGRIKRACS